MGALTLFDFEVENNVTESDIEAAFEIFKQDFKKLGNYHSKQKSCLSKGLYPYYLYFEERGWVKLDGQRVIPNRALLDYHTSEEAIEPYQTSVERFLSQKNKCWYKDFLSIRNHCGPYEFKTNKDKEEYEKLKKQISKEVATTLGLEHFLNVPSSRGSKMNRFDSKWEKKHVIPMIASKVIHMTDFDEIKKFFRTHAFFCGRRDWIWKDCTLTAPYPEFKTVMLTEFDIACLTEANDEKTVALILSYTGGGWTNFDSNNRKILYPLGWSYKRYQESLTFDDVEKIFSDIERLNRLHGGHYLNVHSA
jgi:hypothetical protein